MVENELSQVILNIVSNAQHILLEKKSNEEKWLKITTNILDDKYIICVEDNAGGVPAEIKDKIFEPYFTTKFKSQGTGLGLSMSYDIIKNSIKGDLYFINTTNGAKFIVEVPLKDILN
jgi:C4-dicarboxylate-specific signal transduction histidine kinase